MLYCYNAQLGLGAGLELTRLERLSALWRKKTPADLQGRTPPWPCRGYSCSNLSTRIYGNPLRWYFQKERVCNNSLGRQENTLISVFLSTLIILSFMLIQYHVFTTSRHGALYGRCSKLDSTELACSFLTISRYQWLQSLTKNV